MQLRAIKFLYVTLAFLVFFWAGSLAAQEHGAPHGVVPEAASGPPSAFVEPFAVPVTPGVYLANFMLVYFSSPDLAANMPAYRAPLPQEVYQCLLEFPEGGCWYPYMAPYFAEQALEIGGSRNKNTFWPNSCQIDPRWQALAVPEYRQPEQINQPLGRKEADQLARLLSIDQDMILTETQYECMLGIDPPSDTYGRDIIRACLHDFTSTNGHAAIPLASYGLGLDEQGYVRSDCAPDAPCLEFNDLAINGDLWSIAVECRFEKKLVRLIGPGTQTPFPKILLESIACQKEWGPKGGAQPSCIVETTCPGNGGQSNNNCAASSVTQ